MKRNTNAAAIIIIILVVAAIAASVYFIAKPQKNQQIQVESAIDIIPADADLCIVVNNMDMALGGLDQYLAGISPVPAAISMAARMPLASITGDPALANINTQGQFAAFVLTEPGEPGPNSNTPFGNIYVFLVVPVKDFSTLIKDNASYSEPDDNGIYTVTANMPSNFEMQLLCKHINNHLILTGTNSPAKQQAYEKLTTIGTSEILKNSLNHSQLDSSSSKPFWMNIDIENVNKKFGPQITEQLNNLKLMFADMPNQQGVDVAAIMDIYFKFIEQALKETDSLSVSLDAKPDMLHINKYIKPLDDSDIQKALAGSSASTINAKSFAYLKENAAMNVVMNLKDPLIKNIQIASLDFFQMLNPAMTDEQMTDMIKFTENCFDAIGSTAVGTFAMDGDPNIGMPIDGVYIIDIADKAKFAEIMKKAETCWDDYQIGKLYDVMGINMDFKIEKSVETYKDIAIDKATLTFAATDANSPQAQMIKAMYGEGFLYHWATVNDKMVCGIGAKSSQAIKESIDSISAGKQFATPADVQTALSSIENSNTADIFGTYDYLQIFKWSMTAMANQPGIPNIDLSKVNATSESSIAFAIWATDDAVEFEFAIPKQHLTDIINVFKPMTKMQNNPAKYNQ